jgi:hypothetical protein
VPAASKDQLAQSCCAALADRLPYRSAQPIGFRLETVTFLQAGRGERAIGFGPTLRSETADGGRPLRLVPSAGQLGQPEREPPRTDLQHQAFAGSDLVRDERGNVDIAAPLAHHRELLPQCNQLIIRQLNRCVRGSKWPSRQDQSGDYWVDQRSRLRDLLCRQMGTYPPQPSIGCTEPRCLQ